MVAKVGDSSVSFDKGTDWERKGEEKNGDLLLLFKKGQKQE